MYETFGAREINRGEITFRLFFPDSARDPSQYVGGGQPWIKAVRVVGDFQVAAGQKADWDPTSAPPMAEVAAGADPATASGQLYQQTAKLADGFYEYLFHVTFQDGTVRWVSDPCSRYGGKSGGNSGFVLGGRDVVVKPIAKRLAPPDLVVYELNIDDYTKSLRGATAPLDAITTSELQRIKALGFNAIELMPWTAWPSDDFSWGYNPFQYFSVSHVYTNNPAQPSDKLALLGDLVNRCHDLDLHVIMDGVFNHAEADPPDSGFGYYWLYRSVTDSPFVGYFDQHAFFRDLDYVNQCLQTFILDVCKFWIDNFKIDGIRFDNTQGYSRSDDRAHGLPRLLADLRAHLRSGGIDNFTTMMEDSWGYDAVDAANRAGASGCWYDQFRSVSMSFISQRSMGPTLMRMLDSARDFDDEVGATIYLENHDHQAFMLSASADRAEWWRMQPYLIALYTCPGAVLVHNGQEYANSYWMPEEGDGRVVPRPIDWATIRDVPGNAVAQLFTQLAGLRAGRAALRGPNFYPRPWDESHTTRDADGLGIDVGAQVCVFHRWLDVSGKTERLYVVLNFSDDPAPRSVSFKVAVAGTWTDLLSGDAVTSSGNDVTVSVGRCWGRVLWRVD